MYYLLFAVYLLLLCWLLLRVPFIKNAGISSRVIVALFLTKILAGIAIGWISINIYGAGNDYWDVHDAAWIEYQVLLTDPGKYFSDIFTTGYEHGYTGLFNSVNSYWNDLRSNIIIKLVSLFNIFSRGNYYINSLFFNFFIFFGHIILYRLFIQVFPKRKWGVIIGCFLLPSTLYFTSGIHRDGLVFLFLAVLIYSIFQSLHKNKLNIKRVLLILLSLLLLFLVRNFIFLALLPAVGAWIVAAKWRWHPALIFTTVYLASAVLFFGMNSVISAIDPPGIVAARQSDYLQLPVASTQVPLSTLKPDLASFLSNAPQALNHSVMRPYLWELPKKLLPFALELFCYQMLLVLLMCFLPGSFTITNKPFIYFCVFFTLTIFLLIGYIVPNLGSLVRYRSLYLPLLIVPLLGMIPWEKLARIVNIKK